MKFQKAVSIPVHVHVHVHVPLLEIQHTATIDVLSQHARLACPIAWDWWIFKAF